jgi:hypothetical protein
LVINPLKPLVLARRGLLHKVHDLQYLWNQFLSANKELVLLVKKFEVIEEIVATYLGLEHSAPEVSLAVINELAQVIRNQGYWSLFYRFIVQGIRKNYERALPLMEFCTIILATLNVSLDEALAVAIGTLDTDAKIGDVDDWLVAKFPHLEPTIDTVKTSRRTPHWPFILLAKQGNEVNLEVTPVPTLNCFSTEIVLKEAFWESLRQQINWAIWVKSVKRSAVSELTCPYKHGVYPCCGGNEAIRRLWMRLPKQYQAVLTTPSCGI